MKNVQTMDLATWKMLEGLPRWLSGKESSPWSDAGKLPEGNGPTPPCGCPLLQMGGEFDRLVALLIHFREKGP